MNLIAFVLLSLAAFRTWRAIAWDTIFQKPRLKLLEGRPKLEEFLHCPWCSGLWCAVLWWVAWLLWPVETLFVAVPLAMAAVVALLDRD